jgi:hypothetical protein
LSTIAPCRARVLRESMRVESFAFVLDDDLSVLVLTHEHALSTSYLRGVAGLDYVHHPLEVQREIALSRNVLEINTLLSGASRFDFIAIACCVLAGSMHEWPARCTWHAARRRVSCAIAGKVSSTPSADQGRHRGVPRVPRSGSRLASMARTVARRARSFTRSFAPRAAVSIG